MEHSSRLAQWLRDGAAELEISLDKSEVTQFVQYFHELKKWNEKINLKVREHSLAKVPVLLVVGRREAEEGTVAVRRLGSKTQEILALDQAVHNLRSEAASPAGTPDS